MLLSQLQNGTQRFHQKPSHLSDAVCCKTSQLRWIVCLLQSNWTRLAFFFCAHFYSIGSLSIRRGLSCCTVDSHWVEPWIEGVCGNNANHIIFLPSLSDRKNSWRAWIVLRILFQPLSHTGPRPLCGSHRSEITQSYSQLYMTLSETWKKHKRTYDALSEVTHYK